MRDVKYSALARNRTPVSRVAGENSTTEQLTRHTAQSFLHNFYYFAVDLIKHHQVILRTGKHVVSNYSL